MLKMKTMLITAAGACVLGASAVSADTVRALDDDRLLVTDYSGKPPFERRIINSEHPDFARFEQQLDDTTLRIVSENRSGPPGKSLPAQRSRSIQVDPSQIAEFARFEEVAEPSDNGRMWRGAPGKGRPRLNR